MDDGLTPAQLCALEDVRAYVLSREHEDGFPPLMWTGEDVLNEYAALDPDPVIQRQHGKTLEIMYDVLNWHYKGEVSE